MYTLTLAPIRGITDAIFRTCLAKHFSGISHAVAPFIATVKAKTVNPSHLKDILPQSNQTLPVVPQILGNNADDIVTLAGACADLGYACVNLNLGCPAPQVVSKKRGSGLLPHPDRIAALLDSIIPRLPCALSIKSRLGYADPGELPRLIPILNRYPLAEIIIHARRGVQGYTGDVDLENFKTCLQVSRHSVVYNGDIVSRDYFKGLQTQLPALRRFMIGRGLLANPLLTEQILQIENPQNAQARIAGFYADLFERYRATLPKGDRAILGRMKGLWFYLAENFADKQDLLKKIQRCKTCKEYEALVKTIFNSA